ncbi:MAG TPA: hypothetical protein VFN88_04600 [Caulobacteraceae bacterium]|nr:hypothetical protein [Caulobacteraceae bacterium]
MGALQEDTPSMRGLATLLLGLTIAGPALAQDQDSFDVAAAPPDHVSMTNAKVGGAPPQAKQKAKLKANGPLLSLLSGGSTPTPDEIRAALNAEIARNPELARMYAPALDPSQQVGLNINVDSQGNRTVVLVGPDGALLTGR